jgi:hypothetical protein
VDSNKELEKRTEALRAIYRTDGRDVSEEEARALLRHWGKKPFWAAVICIVLILGLLVFLILRFVL